MLQVNLTHLKTAIDNANVFTLPEMDEGTEYLFVNIYLPLSRNETVTLSALDFDSFEADDIASFSDLYENVLEKNGYQAEGIMNTLRRVDSVCRGVAYV